MQCMEMGATFESQGRSSNVYQFCVEILHVLKLLLAKNLACVWR